MVLKPCAEGDELVLYGADCSGCMTVSTFESALYVNLDVPKRKSNQRNGQCACLLGVDIGAYDTCGHLCRWFSMEHFCKAGYLTNALYAGVASSDKVDFLELTEFF